MRKRNPFVVILLALTMVLLTADNLPGQTGTGTPDVGKARKLLFRGKLSSIRDAAAIFDQAVVSPTYAGDQQVVFLHALTRTLMLAIDDKGGTNGSILELARTYGVEVQGDNFMPMMLESVVALDVDGKYSFPASAPKLVDLLDMLRADATPEVADIIAELDTITDSAAQPFTCLLYPAETGLNHTIEVDYAEVLLLKGLLYGVKGLLEFQSAYDRYCGQEDDLVKGIYGDNVVAQNVLDQYPLLLKILPTANEPATDGKALLLQSRQNVIDALNYATGFINYMANEQDDQSDDLLLINDRVYFDKVLSGIEQVRSSLVNDTIIEAKVEDDRYYNLTLAGDYFGVLKTNMVMDDNLESMSLAFEEDSTIYCWKSGSVEMDNYGFIWVWFELDYAYSPIYGFEYGSSYGEELYLEGRISKDRQQIDDITLSEWDYDEPIWSDIEAVSTACESRIIELDLNPLFGGTARYPQPVAIRDILPVFDYKSNIPLAGTIGYGLMQAGASADFAATLGGILPQATQNDWKAINLVNPADVYIQAIADDQLGETMDGTFVTNWHDNQKIYDRGGVKGSEYSEDDDMVDRIYLARDSQGNYYGSVVFNPQYASDDDGYSNSFSMDFITDHDFDSDGDVRMYIESGWAEISIKELTDSYVDWWGYSISCTNVSENTIDFVIGNDVPLNLAGKYFAFNSELYDWDTEEDIAEQSTDDRSRIVGFGSESCMHSVSGQVVYDNWQQGPIFVQACANRYDLDDSVLTSVALDAPGSYTLSNIPDNFDGVIRAVAPNFPMTVIELAKDEGYNTASIARAVEASDTDVTGFDLVIDTTNNVISNAVAIAVDQEILCQFPEEYTKPGMINFWYSFSPEQDGVYDITNISGLGVEVLDAGTHALVADNGYDDYDVPFAALAGKQYLIRIFSDSEYEGGIEWLSFTVTRYADMQANDLPESAIALALDVETEGMFESATGLDITQCCCDDNLDLWYSFTPSVTGVYQLYKYGSSITLAVYEGDITNPRGEARNCDETLDFRALAGVKYLIRCGNNDNYSTFYLTLTYTGSDQPTNDNAAGAKTLVSGVPVWGNTNGASADDDEPYYKDVWFEFVPEQNGIYEILTFMPSNADYWPLVKVQDSTFDVVYDEFGDDGYYYDEEGYPVFYGIAGARYYIRAAFPDAMEGNFILLAYCREPGLANDCWPNATELGLSFSVRGTTIGATGMDITDEIDGDRYDVWYKFTPQADGLCRLSISSDYDARFSVFTRNPVNADNKAGELLAMYLPYYYDYDEMRLKVNAGQQYYIRVACSDGGAGDFTLNAYGINWDRPIDLTMDGSVNVADMEVLANNWLEEYCYDHANCLGADYNRDDIIDLFDFAVMAAHWLE